MTQLLKFSVVGVLNTLIHFFVFYFLFQSLGVHHLLASSCGFIVAVTNSYALNRYWTFEATASGVYVEFARFFTVSVVALLVNLLSMTVLVEWFDVYPPIAQIISIAFTLAINFLGNKHWSFRQPR